MRYRAAICFAIEGDVRFISHHDTMRLFERAIARSGLPVKFSEGFNPRPRFSLPLPRPVGIASQADVLVLEMAQPVEPCDVLARLSPQMPGGIELRSAWIMQESGTLQPVSVTSEVSVPPEQGESAGECLRKLLSAPDWFVRRDSANGEAGNELDMRPLLVDASAEGEKIRWTVRVTNAGSVRPAEFLSAIGLCAGDLLHKVRRMDVEWSQGGPQPEPALTAQAAET